MCQSLAKNIISIWAENVTYDFHVVLWSRLILAHRSEYVGTVSATSRYGEYSWQDQVCDMFVRGRILAGIRKPQIAPNNLNPES